MNATPLSHEQQWFIHHYLLDFNASSAARRAGYADNGSHAARLMKNPLIHERIALGLAGMFAELHISPRDLLQERARAALFRPAKLLDEHGKLLPLNKIDPDTLAALTIHHDLRPDGKVLTRIRQPDRNRALAALEKAHALVMQYLQRSLAPEQPEREEEPATAEQCAAPTSTASVEPTKLSSTVRGEPVEPPRPDERRSTSPGKTGSGKRHAERPATPAPAAPLPLYPENRAPPYDFRKDPEWMLGGAYRFKDHGLPPPVRPRTAADEAKLPAQPPPTAPQHVPLVTPAKQSSLATTVKRAFGSEFVPPWRRGKSARLTII